MPKKIRPWPTQCPFCAQPRHVYRHSKTWRVFCPWCQRFWRFNHKPIAGEHRADLLSQLEKRP